MSFTPKTVQYTELLTMQLSMRVGLLVSFPKAQSQLKNPKKNTSRLSILSSGRLVVPERLLLSDTSMWLIQEMRKGPAPQGDPMEEINRVVARQATLEQLEADQFYDTAQEKDKEELRARDRRGIEVARGHSSQIDAWIETSRRTSPD